MIMAKPYARVHLGHLSKSRPIISATFAGSWSWEQCVTQCACLPPLPPSSLRCHQIILLGETGTWAWALSSLRTDVRYSTAQGENDSETCWPSVQRYKIDWSYMALSTHDWLVIHYWIGGVQDSHGASVSQNANYKARYSLTVLKVLL